MLSTPPLPVLKLFISKSRLQHLQALAIQPMRLLDRSYALAKRHGELEVRIPARIKIGDNASDVAFDSPPFVIHELVNKFLLILAVDAKKVVDYG